MPAPDFTAHLRGNDPGADAAAESERLRSHEGSRAYRLTAKVAGKAYPPRGGLAERRRAVEEIEEHPLYRAYVGARRILKPSRPPADDLEQRVEAAIDLLATIPFQDIQRRGWHFQPKHFYWPLNDVEFLTEHPELWHGRGAPPGIDWDIDGQKELAERCYAYRDELSEVPELPTGKSEFVWRNNAFGGADALILYGLIRELKPQKVLEIGCGWSSLLLERALPDGASLHRIEPFPNPDVDLRIDQQTVLQLADLSPADDADVVFYDGSHCSNTASDLNWFMFELLPRVKVGAWVHFHDVFWPDDYHDNWVLDEGLSWNEQYLLQAFLTHNERWKVRIVSHMVKGDGGSAWLQRVR